MGVVDELRHIFRKEEYDREEENNKLLTESANNFFQGIKSDMFRSSLPSRRLDYELAFSKEIICECVGNLYVSSLVIDEPEKYSDTLKKEMREQCMNIMESANNVFELHKMFENASHYVKDMFPLIESCLENKTDDDVNEFDGNILLTDEDKKLISDFEENEGKETYAEELQNRVIDVYKNEQEMGEARKEKIQAIVDKLVEINKNKKDNEEKSEGNAIAESVEQGMNMFAKVPETLFKSIFVNKSRMIMNEDGTGADLSSNSEEILAETICTYTLLECINALGIKTFTDEERTNLKYSFFVGK